jgi:hypothetical protein
MIPFILAAIGGYLIGDSVGEEIDSKIPKFDNGGAVRNFKGYATSSKIENSRIFRQLIESVYNNQSGEKYPIQYIIAVARGKNSIVKLKDGKNYVKSPKGVFDNYEFLDDPNFIRALEYVDRPKIRKFELGGDVILNGYPISKTIAKTKRAIKYFEEEGTDYEKKNNIPNLKEYLSELENIKYSDGGETIEKEKQLDYMRVAPSTFEEDMKETEKYFGDSWNTLTEEQKIKLKDELKGIGIVGHSGQQEDLDTYMYSLFYKKGGKTNG